MSSFWNFDFSVKRFLWKYSSSWLVLFLSVTFFSSQIKVRTWFRSSRPEVFCKKGVRRNLVKFTGKHLCQCLFFNKVAGWGLKKETLTQVFSCEFCEISKNTFSYRTPPVAASANLTFSVFLFWVKEKIWRFFFKLVPLTLTSYPYTISLFFIYFLELVFIV